MAMGKVLRLLFISYILCIHTAALVASPGKGDSKSLLFLRNHVSVESGFSLLQVKVQSEFGQGNMRLSGRPGMFLGFKYHLNLNDHFSFRFGQVMGLHSFRFDFDPGQSDTAVYSPVSLSIVKPYLSIPIEVNARIKVRQRHIVGLVVGVSANLFAAEKLSARSSLTGDPMGQEVYTMQLIYIRPNPFVNFIAGIEYNWVLRNLDMINFALKCQMGIRPLLNAQYEHKDNDLVLSSGSFNSFNNYISLSVGYVFTRVNKLRDK